MEFGRVFGKERKGGTNQTKKGGAYSAAEVFHINSNDVRKRGFE